MEDLQVPSFEIEPHLLITTVRRQYYDHLYKLLQQNYALWRNESTNVNLAIVAMNLELKAAARAMVVPLYRQALRTMIISIKQYTDNEKPHPLFDELYNDKHFCDKSSQTENVDFLHKQNEIKNSSVDTMLKCDNHERKDSIGSESCPDTTDKIMQDLEELFRGDDSEINECDIFGDVTNERQIKLIMEEIQQYEKKSNGSVDSQMSVLNADNEAKQFSLDRRLNVLINVKNDHAIKNCNEIVYSRWPCELYFQKKKLREKLDDICEKSFRLHSKVKSRFVDLFGTESEDEQSLLSPDTSINFIRSCRQRITPWVARHIRPYYSRGHIPSHLLKPLMKHLIYKQIDVDQYPSDYEVYLFIKEYFKHHTRIKCQSDF